MTRRNVAIELIRRFFGPSGVSIGQMLAVCVGCTSAPRTGALAVRSARPSARETGAGGDLLHWVGPVSCTARTARAENFAHRCSRGLGVDQVLLHQVSKISTLDNPLLDRAPPCAQADAILVLPQFADRNAPCCCRGDRCRRSRPFRRADYSVLITVEDVFLARGRMGGRSRRASRRMFIFTEAPTAEQIVALESEEQRWNMVCRRNRSSAASPGRITR